MKKIFRAITTVLTFLLLSSIAYAVPNLISYQGVLNDDTGQPIKPGGAMPWIQLLL